MRLRLRSRRPYTGPLCWVPFDQDGPDGKHLEGGWHYSTRMWRGIEIPDRKLHRNDSAADEGEHFYEFAEKDHLSWVEKHGEGNLKMIEPN